MAKSASAGPTCPASPPPTPSNLDTAPGLDAMVRAVRAQAKVASACGTELMRFAAQRLGTDQQFVTEAMACRDWAAFSPLQGRWAAEALTDYLQEGGRLAQLLWGAGLEEMTSDMLAWLEPTGVRSPRARMERLGANA